MALLLCTTRVYLVYLAKVNVFVLVVRTMVLLALFATANATADVRVLCAAFSSYDFTTLIKKIILKTKKT